MGKYNMRYKLYWAIYLLICSISSIIGLLQPKLNGKFIDFLVVEKNKSKITIFVFIFLFLTFLGIIVSYISSKLSILLNSNISYDIYKATISHIHNSPFSFIYQKNSIYLNELISSEASTLTSFSLNIIQNMLTNIITIFYSIYFTYKLLGFLGLISLAIIPLYYIIYTILKDKLYIQSKRVTEIKNQFSTFMNELIVSGKFIKINNLSSFLFKKSDKKYTKLVKETLNYQKLSWIYQSSETLISAILNIFIMIVLGNMILKGKLTIGDYTVILSYFSMTISSSKYFFNFGQTIQEITASYDRLDNILRLKNEPNGNYELKNIDSIKIDNMSFSYGDNKVFNNYCYHFTRGHCYIVTGNNGKGKSTLIDIIIGLHLEQTNKSIKFNNINSFSINLKKLRKDLLAYSEQDTYLIEDTILNNILLDSTDYDHSKLNELIEYFNFKEKIKALPQGLNTILYQNVINLSGGEKRKISLIRTFLKDSDLIILDEPTNDLDNNTKEKLITYIKKCIPNKIIIIITHDNDLLSLSDSIISL